MRPTEVFALPLLSLLAVISVSCGGDDPNGSGVFVGALSDGEVFAASIWQPGDRALVYTCGRDRTLNSATSWLIGDVVDGTVEVNEPPFSVVVTREGSRVMGTFASDDGAESITLNEVSDSEAAGFFVHVAGECRSAAVVFEDSGELVFQGAHFCDDGLFFQITPVRPPDVLGDSIRVQFDDGSGIRELDLDRLEAI